MVATDGHRLAYASGTVSAQNEKREVILPRKAVIELSRLLAESDESVEVEVYANQVKFRFGDVELTTKVIDGKFPDYTRVIPTNYQKHFTVDRIAAPPGLAARGDPLQREVPRRPLDDDGEQFADFMH